MAPISRRGLLKTVGTVGALSAVDAQALCAGLGNTTSKCAPWEPSKVGAPLMRDPVWVYDNWSAYTDGYYKQYLQLPDETRLTEELAIRQLQKIVQLKESGVHFDYYMMNAFWFAPDGAYRSWRRPDWPRGPDRWIAACQKHGLRPGLWFGANSLWKIDAAPQWQDSLALRREPGLQSMSFYEGGFLPDFMETLQYWYERGIRLFELDVADFDAATAEASKTQSPDEIRRRNESAFRNALQDFRHRNPDVMLVAFNGFGGDLLSTAGPFPFKKPIDLRWLEVFDTLYSGDIRVSDVPHGNFWRSVDLFNDHMVRRYEQSFVPLERIDPFFTLSTTWFGYKRGKQAWKSMLLLTAARGSWKKTIYGDLTLLDGGDAHWFSKVQRIYAPLLAMGRTKTFGGIPGEIEPYGFGSFDAGGAIYTVMNPTQEVRDIEIPRLSREQVVMPPGRVLFRDVGYSPTLDGTKITLGPGQMSVLGFGRYAANEYDLGVEKDVVIPLSIETISGVFHTAKENRIEATIVAPDRDDVRIILCQRSADEPAPRSPYLKIEAEQDGRKVTVMQPDQDRAVSTGISWAAGEIRNQDLASGRPITIRCSSAETRPVTLQASLYAVSYGVHSQRS